MTIVKGSEFNELETVKSVSNAIPSAKMVGNIGAEMSYILDESSTKLFKGLFEQLEGTDRQVLCHVCVVCVGLVFIYLFTSFYPG